MENFDERILCKCGSSSWNTLTSCYVCGDRCCNECGEAFGESSVACSTCMKDAVGVLESIKPELFSTILDLMTPDQPLPLELFREIVECASVSEVQAVFKKHAVTPCEPERKPNEPAGNWTEERRAA